MDEMRDCRLQAIERLPGLVRVALRDFKRLTGQTAVATFAATTEDAPLLALVPAVHPLCARKMRGTDDSRPCDREWRRHLRFAQRSRRRRQHLCPLGLHCACVPIILGGSVQGIAKCVCSAEVPHATFARTIGVLELLIARSCHMHLVLFLQNENDSLRNEIELLRHVGPSGSPSGSADARPPTEETSGDSSARVHGVAREAFDYLCLHHAEADLSLAAVARALGRNEKYLSHLFAQQTGVRMRTFITLLRVRHACALLLQSSHSIERIARDSGFAHAAHFRQVFHRSIGVTASQYRRIYSNTARKPGRPLSQIG